MVNGKTDSPHFVLQPSDGPSLVFGAGNSLLMGHHFFRWWEQLFSGIIGQWWLTNSIIIS